MTYYYGTSRAHSPLFYLHSLTLHKSSTYTLMWNVNDHPEGQKEKVGHFHAMHNMQISRQISGSSQPAGTELGNLDSSVGVAVKAEYNYLDFKEQTTKHTKATS